MGYYTHFELKIDRDGSAIIEALSEISEYSGFDQTSPKEWQSEERWKWYDHEDNLKDVSKRFPASVIAVTGYGEEQGDIWRKYFVAGEMQSFKLGIKFPPCTLTCPELTTKTIEVTVLGRDVPVEVEYIVPKTDDELYAMAKAQLKAML